MTRLFRAFILPGLIFQSVVVGGGYATGRELVAFFFPPGPAGGLAGLAFAGLIFGVALAIAFEFARVTGSYDYRSFCRNLLGPGWVLFEFAYILLLILILSVIGAASGELVRDALGWPPLVGAITLAAMTGVLTFLGSETISRVLAAWSFLLYAVYIIMFIAAFATFGDEIAATFDGAAAGDGWFSAGVSYAGYNIAVIPAVLFSIVALKNRRETIGAGLIAGALAVIPAMLFFVAMMGAYPAIGEEPVPAVYLMAALNIKWLNLIFEIVVFGTFIETGTGLLHAVNERISANFAERSIELPKLARPAVAVTLLFLSVTVASAIGIVDLIANGYGALTYGFLALFVLPLLTVGLWRIIRSTPDACTD